MTDRAGRSRGRRSPVLLGRDAELAEIRALAESAATGRGSIALISGEAGVGKSALVDAALEGGPLRVARGAASSVAASPLGPIRAAFAALRRDMPSDLSSLEPVADAIVSSARQHPLALVLDDLQWADHATLELVAALAKHVAAAPLLVVGSYRSDAAGRGHPLRSMRDSLARQRVLREIPLAPLNRTETAKLVTQLLGRELPRELGAAIAERTGGVPFLVEALASAIRGRETADTLPLPESVRDAVLDTLDAVAPVARRAAEIAAVAGSEFSLELLAAVNGGDAGLEALLESGLIVEREHGAAAFRTPLAREAVYAAIPWTRRRSLHRRIAEILEGRGESFEHLAAHWLAADEPQRARRALLAGAARAKKLFAHRDMVLLLRRALDLWPAHASGEDEAERLAVLDQLGDAAQAAGLLGDAMRAWREVAESAGDGPHARLAARGLRKIANLHDLKCDWARAVEARQDAMGAFAAAGEHGEAAVEGITAAIRLRISARYAAGMEVVERAIVEAEASGRADLQVRAAALKGNLVARQGRFDEGIAAIRSALDAAIALDQPALAGEIYQRLADAIERSSDFRSGAATNRQGIAFCEERSQAGGVVACLTCMCWILVRGGEWEQATTACRQLVESPACNPMARTVALGNHGLVHVLRGELKKGEPLLIEADALARRFENALMELICRWGLALQDALEQGPEAAAERCRALLARWRRTEERHVSMPILRWSASVFAQVGDRDELRACADAFGGAAAAFSHAEPLSALAHVLGEIAWLEGDLTRAGDQFEHAVALLEDMQLPRERVESLLRASAARGATDRREAAVAHAREAARIAERLGARPLWERAAARRRELGEPLAGALGPRGASRAENAGLTLRQLQILREISRGMTDKEIARALRLSPRTVEMHVAHALSALDCRSRAEAVRKASELGVLSARLP